MATARVDNKSGTRGTAKLTSKGQCTIPKSVRDELGLKPGDEISFTRDKDGRIVVKRLIKGNPLEKWVGFLKNPEGLTSDEWVREMRGGPGPDEKVGSRETPRQ